MNESFQERLQQEYITSLIAEFVKRANNGTLNYENYCDEGMDVITYIENILRAFTQGYGPLA